MIEPIEIESPSQTYADRYLPPASEWSGSTLLLPLLSTFTYPPSDAPLEVVTLYRARFVNRNDPDWVRTYFLWTGDGVTPCPIENICDECRGSGRYFDPLDRYPAEPCGYCDGRGWFYAD